MTIGTFKLFGSKISISISISSDLEVVFTSTISLLGSGSGNWTCPNWVVGVFLLECTCSRCFVVRGQLFKVRNKCKGCLMHVLIPFLMTIETFKSFGSRISSSSDLRVMFTSIVSLLGLGSGNWTYPNWVASVFLLEYTCSKQVMFDYFSFIHFGVSMWEVDLGAVGILRDSDLGRVGDLDLELKVWDTFGFEIGIEDYGNLGKQHELSFSSKSYMPFKGKD